MFDCLIWLFVLFVSIVSLFVLKIRFHNQFISLRLSDLTSFSWCTRTSNCTYTAGICDELDKQFRHFTMSKCKKHSTKTIVETLYPWSNQMCYFIKSFFTQIFVVCSIWLQLSLSTFSIAYKRGFVKVLSEHYWWSEMCLVFVFTRNDFRLTILISEKGDEYRDLYNTLKPINGQVKYDICLFNFV